MSRMFSCCLLAERVLRPSQRIWDEFDQMNTKASQISTAPEASHKIPQVLSLAAWNSLQQKEGGSFFGCIVACGSS